jgi:hypothetical protein
MPNNAPCDLQNAAGMDALQLNWSFLDAALCCPFLGI